MKEKIKILVVEDEKLIALNLQHVLNKLKYEVIGPADTGKSAIELSFAHHPDIILMDIRLKGSLDGIETAKIIKASQNIPVIYLTSYSDKETLDRAKITDPMGYILKPFDEKELSTVLQLALYKHEVDQKLKENERWLFTTLKSIGEGIIATDSAGKIKFMNPAAEALTGWDQNEAAGKNLTDVFDISDEDSGERVETPVQKVLREGKTVRLTNHTVLKDKFGRMKYISDTAAPIYGENTEITGVVLTFRNVTTKKLSDIALKLSEEKFRSVFEKSAVGMIICSLSGEIIDANKAFYDFIKYSKSESQKINFFSLISVEHYENITDSFDKMNLEEQNTIEKEIRFFTKEGKVAWGYATAVCVSDSKQNYMIIVVQDITQRKKAQQALHEQERNYRRLIESSIEAIYVMQDKKLKLINKAWEDLLGYTRDEVLCDDFDLAKLIAPESLDYFMKRINRQYQDNPGRFEIRAITKEGNKIDLEVSESQTTWEGKTAYQGIFHDITKRKQEEEKLRYATELAEKSNRLKSEFLAQMSHEIRTPLNNILTFTSLLKDELQDKLPAGMESTFSIIDKSAQRLIRTIDSILNISRMQTGNYDIKIEALDLHKDILEDLVLEFYLRAKEKNIELIYENNSDHCSINGDRYSLTQLFANLIDNAVKYTSKGFIKINISNVKHATLVEIQDTGVGISKDFLPNIFNPFTQEDTERTRAFEGTGLGLALVKNYAGVNKALVNVQSQKDVGTTVTVSFFN